MIDFRRPLDATTRSLYARVHEHQAHEAGHVITVRDVPSAKLSIIDSLAKLHALFCDLLPLADRLGPVNTATAAEWKAWSFLADWPSLDDNAKRSLVDKHASYELFFFIKQTDPAFFASNVRPYLAMRLPSECDAMTAILLDDTAHLGKILDDVRQLLNLTPLEKLLAARALKLSAALGATVATAELAAQEDSDCTAWYGFPNPVVATLHTLLYLRSDPFTVGIT